MTDLNVLTPTPQPITPEPPQGSCVLGHVCAEPRILQYEPGTHRYTAEHLSKLSTTYADAPIGASL
jgi:hypothetical protein